MTAVALSKQYEMREMRCGACGVTFWVPEFLMAEREKTLESWYCPNGHGRVFKESSADKIKRELTAELEAEKQRVAMESSMRRTAESQRDKAQKELKRVNKRVNAGVCPHCNRTFQQLSRHMQCKHSVAS